jgi:type II secretory pathway component PulF
MPLFSYTALDQKGAEVKGELEGKDQNDVVSQLRDLKYFPVQVVAGKKETINIPPIPAKRIPPAVVILSYNAEKISLLEKDICEKLGEGYEIVQYSTCSITDHDISATIVHSVLMKLKHTLSK